MILFTLWRPRLCSRARHQPTVAGGADKCGWMVDGKMCYADVALFDVLRETLAYSDIDSALELAPYPLISEWLSRMERVPAWHDYLAERGHTVSYIVGKN